MNSTKRSILDTALRLFNELAYSKVTIRMIAQALDMSSGNLNYHYKKRDAILEALYFDMVRVFDERIEQLEQKEINFNTIKEDIKDSMERMIEFRFFWTDFYNLLQQNETIKRHFTDAYVNRKKGTKLLFSILIKKGLMKSASHPKEHDFLIEKMIGFSNTWLYTSSVYKTEKLTATFIDRQADILLSFLYPYLTETGKKQLEAFIPSFFA